MDKDQFVDAFIAWMSGHIDSHLAWLAEGDQTAVGMAWLAVVDRIPGPEHWLRLAGNLQSVYVIPERRGSGTGALLVQAVIERAHALGLEYISVHPSARSFSLYRSLGFQESSGVLELRGKDLMSRAVP
jgi:GNAT superfamily N-acetyltransferase